MPARKFAVVPIVQLARHMARAAKQNRKMWLRFVKKFLLKDLPSNFFNKKYPVNVSAVLPMLMMSDKNNDAGKAEVLFERKIVTLTASAPSIIPGNIL